MCLWICSNCNTDEDHQNQQMHLGPLCFYFRGQTASPDAQSLLTLVPPVSYRQPLGGVHFNHPTQEVLTVGRDEVGHVEDPQLHLLQEVPQVIVVEGQCPLQAAEGTGEF